MKTALREELIYEPEFEPEEIEEKQQTPQTYVFDPDIPEETTEEEIIYDPGRRRKKRKAPRRRRFARIRRAPRRAYRYIKRKARKAIGWQTMVAVPIALVGFLVSLQQDALAWYSEHDPHHILSAFSFRDILKTLGGGWGRPKDLMEYLKNVVTTPVGLGGIVLSVYSLLPIKRLPLKKIALIIGGSLLVGSILGSAFHASGEEDKEIRMSGSRSITEREASKHILEGSPF